MQGSEGEHSTAEAPVVPSPHQEQVWGVGWKAKSSRALFPMSRAVPLAGSISVLRPGVAQVLYSAPSRLCWTDAHTGTMAWPLPLAAASSDTGSLAGG